jgi:hypothetical protein
MNDYDKKANGDRTYTRTHSGWADTSPSIAVVETVAAITGDEPTAIDPLTESINPDAMDRLVEPATPRSDLSVTFAYNGCTVTAESNGDITVTLTEDLETTR